MPGKRRRSRRLQMKRKMVGGSVEDDHLQLLRPTVEDDHLQLLHPTVEDDHLQLLHPPQEQSPQQSQQDNPGARIMEYITSEYALLKNVFRFLNRVDLRSARAVCRSWKAAADLVNQSRLDIQTFVWVESDSLGHCEFVNEVISQHLYTDPMLVLFFSNQDHRIMRVKCNRSGIPCPYQFRDCPLMHSVSDYIRNCRTDDCIEVTAVGSGIVCTPHCSLEPLEIKDGRDGYSVLFLPQIPGVRIQLFYLHESELISSQRNQNFIHSQISSQRNPMNSQYTLRCLLLFVLTNRFSNTITDAVVRSCMTWQKESLLVAGGFFDHLDCYPPMELSTSKCVVGIGISGEGVTATSCILTSDIRSNVEVDEEIRKLRSRSVLTTRSIAFMFSCVGRIGASYFDEENFESITFRRYFPNTPLFGYYGNGEICNSQDPMMEDVVHTFSTVFVYLSFQAN